MLRAPNREGSASGITDFQGGTIFQSLTYRSMILGTALLLQFAVCVAN